MPELDDRKQSASSSQDDQGERQELDALYRWMLDAIQSAAPESDQQIVREIKPNSRMSAWQRMEVYYDDYLARLRNILRSDFDAVAYALGKPKMNALLKAYIEANPSRHPNINLYGTTFPDFLQQTTLEVPNRAFVVELARLQAAVTAKYNAHDDPAMAGDRLSTMRPDQWEKLVLVPRRTLSLHAFDWPVNSFLRAFYRDEEPAPPTQPEPCFVQISRHDNFRVWRVDLAPDRYALLKRLAAGEALGPALAATAAESERGEQAFMAAVQEWFADWTSDGIFSDLRVE